METEPAAYRPPRKLALALGVLIFAMHHLIRRPQLLADVRPDDPVHIWAAFGLSIVLGFGLAMLWWLLRQTKGQIRWTFRPSRGRILTTIGLAAVLPFVVIDWTPWTVGGLVVFSASLGFTEALQSLVYFLVPCILIYPVAAMIVHHTAHKLWLRIALCALVFWSAYAVFMLSFGVVTFRI